MYTWIEIKSPADYDKLQTLDPVFAPKVISKKLAEGLSEAVRGVLVEFDYVDKDYRSTYYGYYAKKGRRYRADCVRLHFFDGTVTFDEAAMALRCGQDDVKNLSDHYFGYAVLRPTIIATIGRSLLSPRIRRGARGRTISARHKVHLLGYTLGVHGFPSMDQHSDIAVCAHVACWSVLRHYSQRYPQHGEVLLQQVTRMAHHFDPGGLAPSQGLAIAEAERVFHAAGTYPLVVSKGTRPSEISLFNSQFLAYLESGFPLFVGLTLSTPTPVGHAAVVIGRAWDEPALVSGPHDGPIAPPSAPGAVTLAKPAFRAWQLMSEMVVVDDNQLPYIQIPAPGKGNGAEKYTADSFHRFIVALPEKIFYPATAVDMQAVRMFSLLGKWGVKLPPPEDTVIRYFVTTLSRFREEVREKESQFDPRLFKVVMDLPAAQFIWVIEYSSVAQWQSGHVAARVVLDATASLRDPGPAWLAHDSATAIVFDRFSGDGREATFIDLGSTASGPLTRMELNLQPIVSAP